MDSDILIQQIVNVWRRHNRINLLLIDAISDKGLEAIPQKSKGRSVARQLAHMNAVRLGWLHYHATGKRLKRVAGRPEDITSAELKRAFTLSGEAVAELLAEALSGNVTVRLFGGQAIRWLTYLVSHEAHHRGQIALALKQSGLRLPEEVTMKGLWGSWIWGK